MQKTIRLYAFCVAFVSLAHSADSTLPQYIWQDNPNNHQRFQCLPNGSIQLHDGPIPQQWTEVVAMVEQLNLPNHTPEQWRATYTATNAAIEILPKGIVPSLTMHEENAWYRMCLIWPNDVAFSPRFRGMYQVHSGKILWHAAQDRNTSLSYQLSCAKALAHAHYTQYQYYTQSFAQASSLVMYAESCNHLINLSCCCHDNHAAFHFAFGALRTLWEYVLSPCFDSKPNSQHKIIKNTGNLFLKMCRAYYFSNQTFQNTNVRLLQCCEENCAQWQLTHPELPCIQDNNMWAKSVYYNFTKILFQNGFTQYDWTNPAKPQKTPQHRPYIRSTSWR